MKLHQTYTLDALLQALNAVSDTPAVVFAEIKKAGRFSSCFTVFETENMLTTSPHARVTLTRKESETRWAGYMETSAYRDGPKTSIAVIRKEYVLIANDDYSAYKIIMG